MKLKNLSDIPDKPKESTPAYPMLRGGPFFLDNQFPFGKYKRTDSTVHQVIHADPDYVTWALNDVVGFCLSASAAEELERVTSTWHSVSEQSEEPYEDDDDNFDWLENTDS